VRGGAYREQVSIAVKYRASLRLYRLQLFLLPFGALDEIVMRQNLQIKKAKNKNQGPP